MELDPDQVLSKTLREMETNGIQKGIVLGPDNNEVRRWVNLHPDRFLAAFFPDMGLRDHIAAAEHFEQECAQGLWVGLGEISLPYAGRPLNDASLFPYYAVCERVGLAVSFHTGMFGARPNVKIELSDPLLLQDVAMRFPALRIVILHMGWPFFEHAAYMINVFEHIYLEIGAVSWTLGRTEMKRMLVETLEREGNDRILFGSDQCVWPQMITPAVESVVQADYLSDEDKDSILWRNAAELYGIDETPAPTAR